jgi:hypothetical protein
MVCTIIFRLFQRSRKFVDFLICGFLGFPVGAGTTAEAEHHHVRWQLVFLHDGRADPRVVLQGRRSEANNNGAGSVQEDSVRFLLCRVSMPLGHFPLRTDLVVLNL